MTDRKQALIDLRDKVKAGNPTFDTFAIGEIDYSSQLYAVNAFRGSLDAAKALHEAVLPGWEYGYDGSIAWVKLPGSTSSYRHDEKNGFTARAWLIAILEALIAKEDRTND